MKTGKVDMDYWNDVIMPLVESGDIKERKDLMYKGFLLIYQIFNSVLETKDGRLYNVVGWNYPEPYVDIVRRN
jgi:hypothetical protein